MPSSRFFTPDARRLIELHAMALGEFNWAEHDQTSDHTTTFDGMGLTVDPWAAEELHKRLTDLTGQPSPSLESLLSTLAVHTARAGVVRVRSPRGTLRLGAYAAMMLVGELASKCGYLVNDLEGVFAILTRQRPAQARISVRAWLDEHLTPDLDPSARYLVLTPLTQPSTNQQDEVLAVADLLELRTDMAGLLIDVPGRRLPVDASNNWAAELMFAVEREHILGADVVLIVAGPVQSYGAGQSQSWAEANLARVLVVSSHTSRSLGAGYWGTSAIPWVSADSAAEWAADLTKQDLDAIEAHARESAAMRRSWTRHILLPAPRFLHAPPGTSRLPRRRLDALTSAPAEVMNLSGREMTELRKSDPHGFDSSIGAMYGELGLPIGVTATAADASPPPSSPTELADSTHDDATPLTVETILRARPMRGPDRVLLTDFCHTASVTPPELKILLAFADNRYEPQMSYRTSLNEEDLTAWLDAVRGQRNDDPDGAAK